MVMAVVSSTSPGGGRPEWGARAPLGIAVSVDSTRRPLGELTLRDLGQDGDVRFKWLGVGGGGQLPPPWPWCARHSCGCWGPVEWIVTTPAVIAPTPKDIAYHSCRTK